jgi:hypothetical protein
MRRHQKDVRARLNQMREAIVVGDLDAQTVWKSLVKHAEHRLVVCLTGAEHKHNHALRK